MNVCHTFNDLGVTCSKAMMYQSPCTYFHASMRSWSKLGIGFTFVGGAENVFHAIVAANLCILLRRFCGLERVQGETIWRDNERTCGRTEEAATSGGARFANHKKVITSEGFST